MSKLPQIDVFIPVYNDERYIARAINSCLAQEDVDVRVLVSDNCSTDRTAEILDELAQKDARVVVHHNESNIGMIPNLHRLHELVTREFYMFLCSDDLLLDVTAFKSAVVMFEDTPDLMSVYSNIDFLDANGEHIITNRFDRPAIFDAMTAMRQSLISTRNRFGIPVLHRTSEAISHKFQEQTRYSGDLLHSYKVGRQGMCGHIDRSCIGNTYTGGNLTRSLMQDALKEFQFIAKLEGFELSKIEKLRQRFNHHKTFIEKYVFFNVLLPMRARKFPEARG